MTRSKKNAIRIANRRRFRTFLVIIGVILAIGVFELSYLCIVSSNNRMEAEIRQTGKEVRVLTEENSRTEKAVRKTGDYKAEKANEESWERLKERLEKETGTHTQ